MEVDDDQELVIIPVRDKGKDAKLLKANTKYSMMLSSVG